MVKFSTTRLLLFAGTLLSFCFNNESHGRPCANACSGHGTCKVADTDGAYCECDLGWNTTVAPDCSLRSCPFGKAWADLARGVDDAHNLAECSNMGTCNRETGQCACAVGFAGEACDRMECASTGSGICNGKGRCMHLKDAAELHDGVTLFTQTTYDVWDSEKIYGCVCDEGWKGYDCSLRACPKGLDAVGTSYVTEKQVLECTCPTTCSGYFYVGFKGDFVKVFHHDSQAELKSRLESLDRIYTVDVVLYGGTTVCDNDGVSAEITFRSLPGDQPALEIGSSYASTLTSSGSISLSVVTGGSAGAQGGTSRNGDAPIEECSGRGLCSTLFGTCSCQVSGVASTGGLFTASDGEGGVGSRSDCGGASQVPTGCVTADDGSGTPATCAGHGTCDGTTFKCNCNAGYTGHDCKLLACPTGAAWFDEPSAANSAHADAECSNMGHCDYETGACTCRAGFTGTACEKLACPTPDDGAECNGHGTCYTMEQLATLAEDNGDLAGYTYGATPGPTTWDYQSIQGCYCDRAQFHGPFGWDFSDFSQTYDCTLQTCPYGDNPQTIGQVNEVQTIVCTATGGTFRITFRQETTPDIPYNVSPENLKAYLDALYSVHEVTLSFSGGSTTEACSAGGTTIVINFKVPGDLPILTVDSSQLTSPTVTVSETTKGTTEFIMCSGQGTCNTLTGICDCYPGYVSSDGSGDGVTVGSRGDCGAMYIFQTTQLEEGEEEVE